MSKAGGAVRQKFGQAFGGPQNTAGCQLKKQDSVKKQGGSATKQ